jgi:hypothetical protein
VRLGEKRIGVLGVDTHHQATLTARSDRHIAADEERETSEHRLLRYVGVAADQLTDTIGEILVIRHASIIPVAAAEDNATSDRRCRDGPLLVASHL